MSRPFRVRSAWLAAFVAAWPVATVSAQEVTLYTTFLIKDEVPFLYGFTTLKDLTTLLPRLLGDKDPHWVLMPAALAAGTASAWSPWATGCTKTFAAPASLG
jgi:hypothetical protein